MRRFGISSWSLDGLLRSGVSLLDVPMLLRQHGIATLEICHPHIESTNPTYLSALRENLASANIELFSVLIDAGDIASSDDERVAQDTAMIKHWIEIAATLGAERVRISAGLQPTSPQVIERSAAQLNQLTRYAHSRGVAVSTENWGITSQEPATLLAILDSCPQQVGLCVDTGNAEATADKYATVAALMPRATSVHFKARYASDGSVDADDVQRCISLMEAVAFDGPISLIYDRKQQEWAGIERLRNALAPLTQ